MGTQSRHSGRISETFHKTKTASRRKSVFIYSLQINLPLPLSLSLSLPSLCLVSFQSLATSHLFVHPRVSIQASPFSFFAPCIFRHHRRMRPIKADNTRRPSGGGKRRETRRPNLHLVATCEQSTQERSADGRRGLTKGESQRGGSGER